MVLTVVYLISMLDMLALGIIMPAMGPHLLSMGASNFVVGLTGSVFALTQLLTNPVAGSLSDVEGRKPILTKTLALGIASNISLYFLSSSVTGIFITRILHGISSQNMVLLRAFIADAVPADQQAAVFGKMGALGAIGFILGPVIGGILTDYEDGFRCVALILTGGSIISLFLGLSLPNQTLKKEKKREDVQNSSIVGKIRSELMKTFSNLRTIDMDSYGDIFAIKFLGDVALHMFYSAFALVLYEKFNLSQKQLGYTFSINGLLAVISNIIASTVNKKVFPNDKMGITRLYTVFLISIIGYLGSGITTNYLIFVLSLGVVTAVRTLLESTTTELLIQQTTEDDRGTIMGAFESLMSLAGLFVPLVSGIIIDIWGSTIAALIPIFPAIGALYIVGNMKKKSRRHQD